MEILKWIFAIFAVIGAVDALFKSRFGLGEEYLKAIKLSGTLIISMAGMLCIAPSISALLSPVCEPIAKALGIDPSFLAVLIGNDMGGAAIAKELCADKLIGGFNGLVAASMLGVTLTFTLPVALGMVDKRCHEDMISGMLWGIVTLPIGCVASGLMLGIEFFTLIRNMALLIAVSVLTCLGLLLFPKATMKFFSLLSKLISLLIALGLAAGIFSHLTGLSVIPKALPLMDAISVIGEIVIVLAGVFPLLFILKIVLKKPFKLLGKLMGMSENGVFGLFSSLANSVVTFNDMEKMTSRDRVLNMAFIVSASFVFADHLAFTMSFDPAFVAPMIAGKLISGILAVIGASIFLKRKS